MRRLIPYIVFFVFSGCAPKFMHYTPPLPGIISVLETPEFWIEKIPNPDSVLLDEEGIRLLNREIVKKELYFNVLEKDTVFYRKEVRDEIKKILRRFKSSSKVSHSGLPFTQDFWEEIEEKMNLRKMSYKIPKVYGLTLEKIHLRDFPTNEIAVSSRSCEFNRLQVTTVRPFEPVLILHKSMEKDWLYIKSGLAEGWVDAGRIVSAVRNSIVTYLDTPFVVITGADVPLYGDEEFKNFLMWLPMGTRIRLDGIHSRDVVSVLIPIRGYDGGLNFLKAYLNNDVYVNIGHLPYTQRNVIRQSFRLLSFLYGWGGTWDSDDCSGTIVRIFSCFGINLPRNSSQQQKVGLKVVSFNKKTRSKERMETLYDAVPGITIMGWPGHIMLYLGVYEGHHYCLQNIWGFKKKRWFTEDTYYIGKVVVSDLSLGEGTKRGSLLERLTAVRMVIPTNEGDE